QNFQRPLQLAVDDGIQEAKPLNVLERDAANAVGAEQVEKIDLHDTSVSAGRVALRFHAHDDAGKGRWLGIVRLLEDHFNTLAAGLVYKLAEARIVGEVECEALERLLDGVVAVVADGRDLAAARVLHDQALQQVVDVGGGKGEVDPAGAVQFALALE